MDFAQGKKGVAMKVIVVSALVVFAVWFFFLRKKGGASGSGAFAVGISPDVTAALTQQAYNGISGGAQQ